MTLQTLTLGKKRFIIIPEREFRRLQKRAGEGAVCPEFAEEAMRELKPIEKPAKPLTGRMSNTNCGYKWRIPSS